MGALNSKYLKTYAKGNTFIETGSWSGWTLVLAKDFGFTDIYGIELHPEWVRYTTDRFKDDSSIKILGGESPDMLRELCPTLVEPATFWLDAHASGPLLGGKVSCPLVQEINIIGKHRDDHIIFIDDCRLFGSEEWGHLRKEDVVDTIFNINPRYRFRYVDGFLSNDIMIAYTI